MNNDQASRLRSLMTDVVTTDLPDDIKVITISSGKGGVGKSSFTVNFSLALSQAGKKVLIVDADIGMANVDIMLGCMAKDSILSLVKNNTQVEDIIVDVTENVKLLTGGSDIHKFSSISKNEVDSILNKIAIYSKDFDYIIFDTGAGISDNVLNFLLAADEIVVITTPEPTAITDAYVLMKAISLKMENPKISLVVNRVFDRQEAEVVFNKLYKITTNFLDINLALLGFIYDDSAVSRSIREQKPFMLTEKSPKLNWCVNNIAKSFLNLPNKTSEGYNKGIRGFFEKLFYK